MSTRIARRCSSPIVRAVGVLMMIGLASTAVLTAWSGTPDPALNAYTTAVNSFLSGRAPDTTSLRKVAAEPFATQIGKNILATEAAGFTTVGTTVPTVTGVAVSGSSATVTACLDARKVLTVANTATSTAGAGAGRATTSTFTLEQVSGAWLVSGVKEVGACP